MIYVWEQEQEGVLDMQTWHQDCYDNNLQWGQSTTHQDQESYNQTVQVNNWRNRGVRNLAGSRGKCSAAVVNIPSDFTLLTVFTANSPWLPFSFFSPKPPRLFLSI